MNKYTIYRLIIKKGKRLIKPLIILLLFSLSACTFFSHRDEDIIIAKVYDKKLYYKDIVGVVPLGSLDRDSINYIRNYADNWIKQQVILRKAQQNINEKSYNFDKQLEDYKNSLIIYAYEKELVRQKLDTVVTEEQIINYYKQNQKDFLLKNNILKVIYVKLPLNSTVTNQVRKLYKSTDATSLKSLGDYCDKFAVNYFLDIENWLYFNDLLKEIPIKTYNQEEYLKNHRLIEFQDSSFNYFINIVDFKIKESVSPLNFERNNIRDIIVNKRKLQLIKEMHENVYKEALKANEIEIYAGK